MEVKGIVTKSIAEYVKAHFPQRYVEWEAKLPMETLTILDRKLSLHLWQNVVFGAEIPTKIVAELFFDNDIAKAALETGRYSAERSFNGVFRMLLNIISPRMLMEKSQRFFGTFYKPSTTKVDKLAPNHIYLNIYDMEQHSEIIEYRIAGWAQRAFELANSANVEVKVINSFASGDTFTRIEVKWK